MIKIKVYNQEGKEVGEEKLDPAVFGVKVKPELIQQAVVAQMAKARVAIAHTKTRGEVRGGGKKPWRQKGTGRARAGSSRSPIWKGGGVIFGPRKDRVFARKINKKAKRKALLMCLSDKVASGWMVALDKLELGEGKTKIITRIFLRIFANEFANKEKDSPLAKGVRGLSSPLIKVKSILIALEKKDKNVIQAVRNIPGIATISVNSLNVVDLLKYKYFLVTQEGIKKIEKMNQEL